ncbi:LCP family protein [Granulicatella elegans]|uniref:LCP family glycopolymer transferase n=1 Tax=Granulicatella elegans TaxID=137732 RepID=UPI000B3321C6|nr:LCP family protein [Granulicatella elegans]UEA30964.1 LCP family protein [Granulicatella elegans]
MVEQHEFGLRSKRRQKKKKGKLLFIFILISAFLVGASIVFADKLNLLHQTISTITQDVGNRTKEEAQEIIENAKPINILLLGIDNGAYGRPTEDGRSDTMLLLTSNPTEKKAQLLSIPRDTYTEIVGMNYYDKINHAYAYGQAKMAINSVEKLFDTSIDFYMEINMSGLMEFVDAVGGIEVTSPLTFTYEERSFVEGKTELLDGESALRFARMRYDDPEGDYGRQKRQRIVIEQLVKKMMSFNSITNFEKIMNAVSKNVKTDIPIGKIMALKNTYGPSFDHLEQAFIEERSLLLKNSIGEQIYYSYATDEELLEKSNLIREYLGQKPVKTYPLLQQRENLFYLTTP